MILRVLAAGIGIILVDLALSGDNAVVIGSVAARLPRAQQRLAIIWGGFGALVARFVLAVGATELLQLPYLRTIGAVVILIIAIRLLLPESGETRFGRRQHEHLLPAIATITLADLVMSLDNVLAVGALAAGNILLLAGGLSISIALLFVASALVALLINRMSWLMDVAALILGWTASELIIGDPFIQRVAHLSSAEQTLVGLACLALVLVTDLIIRGRQRRAARAQARQHSHPDSYPAHTAHAVHTTSNSHHPDHAATAEQDAAGDAPVGSPPADSVSR